MKFVKALLIGVGVAWVLMGLAGAFGLADHYVYFGPVGGHCWKDKS